MKTHQLPISVMNKERRFRWLGHAARRLDYIVVKRLLLCYGDTEIDLPRDWANLALYRDVWRGVVSWC